MPLFGRPPDIDKLKAKGDVPSLIKAMREQKDPGVRQHAADAIVQIGAPAVEPLLTAGFWPSGSRVDLLVRIGEPAVLPLIAHLGHTDPDVIKALGRIGDARAAEPLVAALVSKKGNLGLTEDAVRYTRQIVVEALVGIGAPAIEPLTTALKGENWDVSRTAADVLDRLHWIPDHGAAGAAYWAVRGDWGEWLQTKGRAAASIASALAPLIAALKNGNRNAAKQLVAIYQSGRLGAKERALILSQRSVITGEHDDSWTTGLCVSHTDEGIGVEFPV
jgi:HEAT repeat protein